jgi:hypothetical protein
MTNADVKVVLSLDRVFFTRDLKGIHAITHVGTYSSWRNVSVMIASQRPGGIYRIIESELDATKPTYVWYIDTAIEPWFWLRLPHSSSLSLTLCPDIDVLEVANEPR